MKQKLKQYDNYDEIKRELEIMKVRSPNTFIMTHSFGDIQYVEFAGLDEANDEANGYGLDLRLPNPNAKKANAQRGNSLEALLATKNKRILEELTKFRVRRLSAM